MRFIKKLSEKQESFWITNISKRIVSLSDLALSIQPMTSINLLDPKHYHLTKQQVIQSAASGSIFKKRDKIIVRQVAPDKEPTKYIPIQENAIFPTKYRSSIEPENTKYDELNVSDDHYAEENAETAQSDHLGKWNKP